MIAPLSFLFRQQRRVILGVILIALPLLLASTWMLVGGERLKAALLPFQTRSDCFFEQRSGRLSPECQAILFGSSGVSGGSAAAVATSTPGTVLPLPRLAMGEKCLSNEQCSSGNCVRSASDPKEPSLMIGTCGCRARPACLDADPPCKIAVTDDMCVCGNGQCEIGEKASCPQDCLSTTSSPTTDIPTCSSCRLQGMGYLCQGHSAAEPFCSGEDVKTDAGSRCVLCPQDPSKCVPEGQACRSNQDCGSCGATCVGEGMTSTSIINGSCTYPALPPTVIKCDYAPPAAGCRYVPGPRYEDKTNCGLVLECVPEAVPPKEGIHLSLSSSLRVGDQADLTVCVASRGDDFFRGWITVTIAAGPTAEVDTHLSYEFRPEDQGCRTFPRAIQPLRPGRLDLSAQDLHFSELSDGTPTMTASVTRMVAEKGEEVVCATDVRTCPDGSIVSRMAPSCQFPACPGWQESCPSCLAQGRSVVCHGGSAARSPFCADAAEGTDASGLTCQVCRIESQDLECKERRGDVVCDGGERPDIADLARLSDILVGKVVLHRDSMARRNADINGDGALDIADLAQLVRFLSSGVLP